MLLPRCDLESAVRSAADSVNKPMLHERAMRASAASGLDTAFPRRSERFSMNVKCGCGLRRLREDKNSIMKDPACAPAGARAFKQIQETEDEQVSAGLLMKRERSKVGLAESIRPNYSTS